jgi:hypothetical protein
VRLKIEGGNRGPVYKNNVLLTERRTS